MSDKEKPQDLANWLFFAFMFLVACVFLALCVGCERKENLSGGVEAKTEDSERTRNGHASTADSRSPEMDAERNRQPSSLPISESSASPAQTLPTKEPEPIAWHKPTDEKPDFRVGLPGEESRPSPATEPAVPAIPAQPVPTKIVSPEPTPVPVEQKKDAPLVALPAVKPDRLTPAGRELIYEFEVGGGKSYYDRFLIRPEWPGAASGVTIGVGYDLGYNSRPVILSDWKMLPTAPRLADVSGYKGQSAHAKLSQVRDILVKWELAEQVYDTVTVTKFWQVCQRTWPGFDKLRPNAQASLLSLTFNRGDSLIGERRREMKTIASLSPNRDYQGMSDELRDMVRVWKGSTIERAMTRRRNAEADLMLMP